MNKFDVTNDVKILQAYQELFNIKLKQKPNNLKEGIVQLIEQENIHSKHYTADAIKQIVSVIYAHITALQNFRLPIIKANTLFIQTGQLSDNDVALWQKQTVTTIKEANHWNILGENFVTQVAEIIDKFVGCKK